MTKTNFEHYKEEIMNCKVNRDCLILTLRTNKTDCKTDCRSCLMESLHWLFQEYKEPKPKYQLTLFAKSILEHAARYNYKYMAWSIGNGLHVYVDEPCCDHYTRPWKGGGAKECITLFLDCFPFLDPKEYKAYSIQEILDNCEVIEK